jgi:photosystem II stability/assembly factor-like uncharacterized protein
VRKSIALISALGVLGLTACASGGNVSSLSELSHIHNMVVHGEEVFIGSHDGLYQELENGQWSRVSKEFDVMALAEVDGMLLASGHPGKGFDLPEPIGLVSSDDSGATWSPTSLTGDVDFHLLEAVGDTVIGVAANYGVLVKSSDSGTTWSTLDVPALTDLAINPGDEKSVWLATGEGLQQSSDGGSTFSLRTTKVSPVLLDWSETNLYGATSDTIWRWDDNVEEWVRVETGFSNISALSASSQYIAVLDGDVLTKLPI